MDCCELRSIPSGGFHCIVCGYKTWNQDEIIVCKGLPAISKLNETIEPIEPIEPIVQAQVAGSIAPQRKPCGCGKKNLPPINASQVKNQQQKK